MSIQRNAGFQPVVFPSNGHFTRAQALSLSFHIALIALLLLPAAVRIIPPREVTPINGGVLPPLTDWIDQRKAEKLREQRKGGGGDHTDTIPTAGRFAPAAWIQFTPPAPVPPKDARMRMQPTLIADPSVQPPQTDHPNWGDPRRALTTLGAGRGHRGGVGTGCCGSVGDGPDGTGIDEDGAGRNIFGGRVASHPACSYCPNPAFTAEAIRVRWQGTVLLRGLVKADGRVTNISVIRGAGMGLDESAVEKVRTWRLAPARSPEGKPVAVWTTIEVLFRQM